ncbi:hypothetical protein BU26DRAFT_23838 [Trematosphaeria pertusa]|uniref:F-box domain-containing protein n=1 Tax=Trematosphaeria pertusa TaxID=390896 RepID=A0A6A6J2F4_9PLEO|nr:uncharacterized protein BU26DRAFT_23838 [Trematosphaeria pertusa]KAF2256527.1 hypothetical protein BU26DRAFT_23838 [Trematosphaeria pertusa]
MSSIPTSPKGTQVSPLLNLPGELRNRIYEHALASFAANEDPALCLTKGGSRPGRRAPALAEYANAKKVADDAPGPHPKLQYFHLLHVCRQIRDEFRPLYLRTPMHLAYKNALTYVVTFYPVRAGQSLASSAQQLVGEICIDVDEVSDGNLVPLLQRLYRAPQLEFHFVNTRGYARLSEDMNWLFKDHAKAWKEHLGTNIEKLAFFTWGQRDFSSRQIEVYFRPQTPGIMGYDPTIPGPLDKILEALGLAERRWIKPHIRVYLGSEQ